MQVTTEVGFQEPKAGYVETIKKYSKFCRLVRRK